MKLVRYISVFVVMALILQLSTLLQIQAAVASGFEFTILKVTSEESVTFSGVTPTPKIYTNGDETLRFTWSATDSEVFDIFYTSGGTPVKINSTGINRLFDYTDADDLSEDEYTFYIEEQNSNTQSSSGIVVIDKTEPNQATSVGLFDSDNDSIGNQSKETIITVKWTASTDKAPNTGINAAEYRVTCRYGNNLSCGQDQIVTTTQATFNLNAGLIGDNVAITFAVSAIDRAGNENTVTTTSRATYTLNTSAPAAPTVLKVFNSFNEEITGTSIGPFTKISFTGSTSADVARYLVQIKKTLSDASPSIVSSGSDAIVYENVLNGISLTNGNDIVVQVFAIDTGGNTSPVLERQFRYDNTSPSFDVKHNSGVTTVSSSGLTLNTEKRGTITVLSPNNDVSSVLILRNSVKVQEYSGSNVLSQTQAYLRTAPTGDYEVIARDAALNRLVFEFTLQVTPPTISSPSIAVSFNDTSDVIGVNGTGVVSFAPATTADAPVTYQLYIDGRPIQTTQGSSGSNITQSFNYRTAVYGDLRLIYEVRAIDASGNFSVYNQSTNYVVIDKVKPYAKILSTSSFSNSVVAEIEVRDYYRVLNSQGARAEIYDGIELIRTVPLELGINSYTFTGLRNRQTDIKIIIKGTYTYDNVTSTNQTLNLGSEYLIDTQRTSPDVTANITDTVGEETSIKLTVNSIKNTTSLKTLDVYLFSGKGPAYTGNPIATKEIPLGTATINDSTEITFTGLNSGVMYHVQVRDGGFIIATARIITNFAQPTTEFEVVTTKGLEMTLGVRLLNSSSANVYLFRGTTLIGNPIPLTQTNYNRFNITAGLDYDTEYSIKVISNTFNVALEELNGNILTVPINNAIIGEYSFRTAKETPIGEIPSVLLDVLSDEVLFSTIITDPDNAVVEASAVLYEGSVIVDEIAIDPGRSNLKFENLKSFTDYTISIHVTYDLNDGNVPVTKQGYLAPSALTNTFVIQNFKTIKALPDAEIATVAATNQSLNVTIQPKDPDNAFVTGTVKIFSLTQSAPLRVENLLLTGFHRGTLQTFSFTGLTADTVYRVEVELDYNLQDGRNVRTWKPVTENLRTRVNISADISTITSTDTLATVVVNLFDYTAANVEARLFQGTTLVGNPQAVSGGTNTLVFDGLQADTQYRVVIDYNNGNNLLVARDIKTRPLAFTEPELSLEAPVLEENRATIQIDVIDPERRTQTEAKIIISDDQSDEEVTITTTVSELVAGKVLDLPFETQTVTVYVYYIDVDEEEDELVVAAPSITRLSSPASSPEPTPTPEPEPTPEPAPEPTPEPAPSPEPGEVNIGAWILGLLGIGITAFAGILIYSFRSVYLR